MSKITLIDPPYFYESNKNYISELAEEAFGYWISYLKEKYQTIDIPRIFPSEHEHPITLGLLCLTSYLKERGIDVDYIHCTTLLKKLNYDKNKLSEFLIKKVSSSAACGFTSTTPSFPIVLEMLKMIKKENPEIATIVGGPHATFLDEEIIRKYDFIDYVVRGEGEETLYEIMKNINNLSDNYEILGATYRRKNKIIKGEERPLLPSNSIPSPDFNILPSDSNILIYDIYSRGCPFECYYCTESKMWRGEVRFRDPAIVAEELERIRKKFKKNIIHIADSEIDIHPQKLKKLINAIRERNIDCYFSVNIRPDAYKRINRELVEEMLKAGIIEYFIGIETGDDYLLEKMNKGCKYSDFLKTLKILNKDENEKIIIPYVMLGFPGETESTLKETRKKFIKLLKEGKISFLSPKVFVPYPGTEPFEHPEKFDIDVISYEWEKYSRFGLPCVFRSKILEEKVLMKEITLFYSEIINTIRGKI